MHAMHTCVSHTLKQARVKVCRWKARDTIKRQGFKKLSLTNGVKYSRGGVGADIKCR